MLIGKTRLEILCMNLLPYKLACCTLFPSEGQNVK